MNVCDKVATWRNSTNPDVILSQYIPFCRDPSPHLDANNSGLPWWLEHAPDLVLYQCDRKTPAWECFPGEGVAVCLYAPCHILRVPVFRELKVLAPGR